MENFINGEPWPITFGRFERKTECKRTVGNVAILMVPDQEKMG